MSNSWLEGKVGEDNAGTHKYAPKEQRIKGLGFDEAFALFEPQGKAVLTTSCVLSKFGSTVTTFKQFNGEVSVFPFL
jgi:hypothetical protein